MWINFNDSKFINHEKIFIDFTFKHIFFNTASAQLKKYNYHQKKIPFIYVESSLGSTSKYRLNGIGFTVSLKNKWGLNYTERYLSKNADDLPADYKAGFCLFGNCTPADEMTTKTLSIQRMFFSKNAKIRFNAEAGLGKLNYTKVEFVRRPPPRGWGIFNTTHDLFYTTENKNGFTFLTSAEFLYTKFTGIKVSTFAFIVPNSNYSHAGLQLQFSFGYVREKVKKRNKE